MNSNVENKEIALGADAPCTNTRCCPPQGTVKRDAPKIGRNEPCPCGSDKKFKKCCGRNA